jgi:aminoglycoside phosphotransferase (APT) family kinase protein
VAALNNCHSKHLTECEVRSARSTRCIRLPLDNLDWYLAFAHFKFAVIAQGINARVHTRVMANQDFDNLTAEVTATAEAGPALAQSRGI